MDNRTIATTTSAIETVPVFTFRPNVLQANSSTPSLVSSMPVYTFQPKILNAPLVPVSNTFRYEPAYTFRTNILNQNPTTTTTPTSTRPSLFGYALPPTTSIAASNLASTVVWSNINRPASATIGYAPPSTTTTTTTTATTSNAHRDFTSNFRPAATAIASTSSAFQSILFNINDLDGKLPNVWIEYLRKKQTDRNEYFPPLMNFFRKCFPDGSTPVDRYMQSTNLEIRISSRVILNAIGKNSKYNSIKLQTQLIANIKNKKYSRLFRYECKFYNIMDPLKSNDNNLSDAQWKKCMENNSKCGSAFIEHLTDMYRILYPGQPFTRCCYLMTLDLAKMVFINELSERDQYRLYVAAIIYGGEGLKREPSLKFDLAMKYKMASEDERKNPKQYSQSTLMQRILQEWDVPEPKVHASYIAESEYIKTKSFLDCST